DLMRALKPFFGARKRAKSAVLDCVDIKAQENEVEFITKGFSSSIEAEVASPGCARFPFPLFETLFRNPQKLAWTSAGRLSIRITEGQIQAGPTTFNHSGVSIQAVEERIADLPIDASVADTLALSFRFTPKELADSGLWDRFQAAQRRADDLIDRACKTLGPLNIDSERLSEFVWEEVRQQAVTAERPEAQPNESDVGKMQSPEETRSTPESERLYPKLSKEEQKRADQEVAAHLKAVADEPKRLASDDNE
ncbi:MAG: hypothetical protein ACRD2L_08170, partial [Terriglobia bacterium]